METESEFINKYHMQLDVGANQCSSILTKHIKAPVHIVCAFFHLFFLLFF